MIAQAAVRKDCRVRIVELGAGTATKTSILIVATLKHQGAPIDISETALDEAQITLQNVVPDVRISPQVSNFLTDKLELPGFDELVFIWKIYGVIKRIGIVLY